MSTKNNQLYEEDFYSWTQRNTELLRQKRFSEVDFENVIEEIESIGRREKRELKNRLGDLILTLLKWTVQKSYQNEIEKMRIKEKRIRVFEILDDSPSLESELSKNLEKIYEISVLRAIAETGFGEKMFNKNCPFTLDQCLDFNFFPKG